jgi:hypothetical protein
MYADLTNTSESIDTGGKDSIVIVDNFQSVRGGRTLDVTGFSPTVIRAGHVIIKETATGNFKPMPVKILGAILILGTLKAGSGYTNNGTYNGVALTGGSGAGATANIVVAGNAVTAVTIVNKGTGYKAGDILSAAAANIGTSGSGFEIAVASVDTSINGYDALPSGHTYAHINISSILTAKPFAGLLVRGTVNYAAAPYDMTSILSAVKTAMPLIDFRAD